MDEIKFESSRIPKDRLSTITAYVDDVALMNQGKTFLHHILAELVKQSVLIHRVEIDNIVTECIMSDETKEYIKSKIRENIDKIIQQEVDEIFKKEI